MNVYLLINGDAKHLPLPDGSIDCVIRDPPYGTTHFGWDRPIPTVPLWRELKRCVKPDAAIVLFGSQPFTSELVVSNREWFRYSLVWKKSISGGVFNAKFRPVKNHEDIVVFSPGAAAVGCKIPMKYRPQGLKPGRRIRNQTSERNSAFVTSRPCHPPVYTDQASGYPKSVIEIGNHNGAFWGHTDENTTKHPTQKPTELMEYLVLTYTDEGDTVLDFAMGSGSTGVACRKTNRKFIGIDIDPSCCETAGNRMTLHARIPRDSGAALPLFAALSPDPETEES